MHSDAIHQQLLAQHGPVAVLGLTPAAEGIKDAFVTVAPAAIDAVCRTCRDAAELRFDFCQSMTGVDAGEQLLCVYHLFSYALRHTLVLKAGAPRAVPVLPSVAHVWPVADWYEREIYDLYGVVFAGHPELRRLLLPEEFVGHPLRKDWVEPPTCLGMPTTRDNSLELLGPAEEAAR